METNGSRGSDERRHPLDKPVVADELRKLLPPFGQQAQRVHFKRPKSRLVKANDNRQHPTERRPLPPPLAIRKLQIGSNSLQKSSTAQYSACQSMGAPAFSPELNSAEEIPLLSKLSNQSKITSLVLNSPFSARSMSQAHWGIIIQNASKQIQGQSKEPQPWNSRRTSP